MAAEIAGFWSYVRHDDLDDGGRILSLSRKLRAEYRIQTGDEVVIFVDRDSLEWGEEWKERINDAIAGTTFFIPVITPSYFHSRECRNELLKFAREAKRLGLDQLLMPVYWVTVPELEGDAENSSDEAIALVSRYQRQDLRLVRLEDESSAAFRKAVSELAADLAERVARATTDTPITVSPQATTATSLKLVSRAQEDDDRPGVLEVLAEGEEALPRLAEILESFAAEIFGMNELTERVTDDLNAAIVRNADMKTRLQIAQAFGTELNKPAANIERLGHEYGSVLSTVDSAMHAVLDAAADLKTPEDIAQRDALIKVLVNVAGESDKALTQMATLIEVLKTTARFSRTLRIPIKRIQTGLQGFLDGRALIDEWARRASELRAAEAET